MRAYFEVPGASGGQPGDFFRMPFPSNAAIVDGAVDYTGFPTPGGSFLGFDPVQRYLDAIEGAPAWSNSPTVIFRFSGPIDIDSFLWNDDETIRPSRFVDVTPGDPDYGRNLFFSSFYNNARSNYVCPHWRAVRPRRGEVLLPGHSYAIYYTDDVTAMNGSAIQRSEHFAAMMGSSAPSDSALAAAWPSFQPLRDYLAFEGTDPDTIINGVVITVGEPHQPMETIAAAIQGQPAPTATDWVKCGGGAESPCPQADAEEGRACGEGTSSYDEYHALVELPIFQEGTAPYLESGGGVNGTPVGTEQVCMSLTVPKATMPAAGWPLVVYAHGTNGSFRSHVQDTVAGSLSNVSLPGGGTVRFAVLGIDGVGHGPRRGDSDASPQTVFFNFANPDAAEGNSLQGGADVIALARFTAALDVDAATTGGDAIAVDPDGIVFFGHSQGALVGALGAPYAPEFQAVALSGGGGSLIHSLLEKRSPVDIAAGLPFVIQDAANDGTLRMGERHPVLALLQHYIDAADPISHAGRLITSPAAGPHHTFVTYGIGDTYTPNRTTELYTIAAGLEEGTPDASANPADDLPIATVDLPTTGNLDGVTGVMRQYGPPGDADGHFVVFDVDTANDDVTRFLGMAADGQVPQVGE